MLIIQATGHLITTVNYYRNMFIVHATGVATFIYFVWPRKVWIFQREGSDIKILRCSVIEVLLSRFDRRLSRSCYRDRAEIPTHTLIIKTRCKNGAKLVSFKNTKYLFCSLKLSSLMLISCNLLNFFFKLLLLLVCTAQFHQNGLANRKELYLSGLGRSRCACWPQSLDESWWQNFADCWQSIRDFRPVPQASPYLLIDHLVFLWQ